ncbi:MAG: hypothetical protein WDO17_05740 [Alphaproteobacteria bacterium]
MDEHKRELHEQLDRLQEELPQPAAKPVRKLRQSDWKWARIPAGILLVIGGLLAFLPVLGLWMLPLGLGLLAIDVPFLRKPMARAIRWGLDKWHAWRGADGLRKQSATAPRP